MTTNPAQPGLPVGWPLIPVPDAQGSLHWPTLEASVRQTIRALLVTEPGGAAVASPFWRGVAAVCPSPQQRADTPPHSGPDRRNARGLRAAHRAFQSDCRATTGRPGGDRCVHLLHHSHDRAG